MENLRNSNNKGGNKKGKFSKFAPILAGALFLMNPSGAYAQNVSNHTRAKAEVSTSNILDRLNQKIGITLPSEYNEKVLVFVLNDTIMHTRSATAYTEEFIINEMKKDRGINKQNQLLFIRSKIYEGIAQIKLYKLLDDTDINRRSEYKKSLKQIANCYEGYEKGFKTYMEKGIAEADRTSAEARQQSAEARQQSAEARQQSAEARQQSAEARQQSAEARQQSINTINNTLVSVIDFYDSYQTSPDSKRFESFKPKVERLISRCKDLGIDYKSKLSPEILKFYGVE